MPRNRRTHTRKAAHSSSASVRLAVAGFRLVVLAPLSVLRGLGMVLNRTDGGVAQPLQTQFLSPVFVLRQRDVALKLARHSGVKLSRVLGPEPALLPLWNVVPEVLQRPVLVKFSFGLRNRRGKSRFFLLVSSRLIGLAVLFFSLFFRRFTIRSAVTITGMLRSFALPKF